MSFTRTFIAIGLDDAIRRRVAALQEELADDAPDSAHSSWVAPGSSSESSLSSSAKRPRARRRSSESLTDLAVRRSRSIMSSTHRR